MEETRLVPPSHIVEFADCIFVSYNMLLFFHITCKLVIRFGGLTILVIMQIFFNIYSSISQVLFTLGKMLDLPTVYSYNV